MKAKLLDKQEKQYTYNVIFRCILAAIVAVEKQ
jgi:hypothetical protein